MSGEYRWVNIDLVNASDSMCSHTGWQIICCKSCNFISLCAFSRKPSKSAGHILFAYFDQNRLKQLGCVEISVARCVCVCEHVGSHSVRTGIHGPDGGLQSNHVGSEHPLEEFTGTGEQAAGV